MAPISGSERRGESEENKRKSQHGRERKTERGRRTGRSERRVRFHQDTTVLAPLLELVRRVEGVQLDLVDGGNDGPALLELLEVRNAPVGESDSLDLARPEDALHARPSLCLVPVAVDGARAVGVGGKEAGRVVRDKTNRPVDEEEVEVVDAEGSERFLEGSLNVVVERVPAVRGGRSALVNAGELLLEEEGAHAREVKRKTHSFEVRKISERGTPDALMPCPTSSSFW
jgi:hypothetical protein